MFAFQAAAIALVLLPVVATAQDSDDDVRIYRCVASNGAVSLQSAPCGNSTRQQVLTMQRPTDPPPGNKRDDSKPADAQSDNSDAPERVVRVVTVQPPQPMYECVTPDGERYTSDTDDGNPRWVPAWTFGYDVGAYHRHPGSGKSSTASNGGTGTSKRGDNGARRGRNVIVPSGNVMVRDTCHALPQQEVCARLSDRRWELIRKYHSALQSEREALAREQRGIDARLARDCGGP